MHEMSIAEGLIEQVLAIAQKNGFSKVHGVILQTGELRQVIPEVMAEAFKAVSAGTIAEQACLQIEEVPAEVRCNVCGKIFYPKINDFLCPDCQRADVSIEKGDTIILASLEGE